MILRRRNTKAIPTGNVRRCLICGQELIEHVARAGLGTRMMLKTRQGQWHHTGKCNFRESYRLNGRPRRA